MARDTGCITCGGSLLIVLLCGGDKNTQSKDIAEAMELAANWTDEEDEA
jgi:putative component of toxin-antitoxin plasmid stabilization module